MSTSSVLISFLDSQDIPEVWSIAQTIEETSWSLQGFTDIASLPTTSLFGAYLSEEPNSSVSSTKLVGYLMVSHLSDESEILTFGVKHDYRHQGIGTLLLENYIHLMKHEWHCHTCHLEVRESNHAAISLYQKLGFVVTGVRRDYYEIHSETGLSRENALMMQLKIASLI